jgi:hypothetical protein
LSDAFDLETFIVSNHSWPPGLDGNHYDWY